jgi:hypothetical protein
VLPPRADNTSKKKYKTNVVFKIYGQAIDLQDSYSYLGVIFNYNRNFCTARKKLLDQANKALCETFRYQDNSAPQLDKSALVVFLSSLGSGSILESFQPEFFKPPFLQVFSS